MENNRDGQQKFAELKNLLNGHARTFNDRILASAYLTAANKIQSTYGCIR